MNNIVNRFRPSLEEFEAIYRSIHHNAELSKMETNTARLVATHLSSLQFAVTQGVGGTGVVGVFHNGEGRCVMLRAELDALPIKEARGYACNKTMEDDWGQQQPVTYAAGHDLHMASLLAAATLMRKAASHWRGTLVVVFQPDKVHAGGAQAMVDQGLYNIAPVPDAIFCQHSGPFAAGHINIVDGPALMSADTIRIKLDCSVGYRANPQHTTKPLALAPLLDGLKELARNHHGNALITLDKICAVQKGPRSVSHVDLVLDFKTDNENTRQKILEAIVPKAEEVCRDADIIEVPPEVETFARAPLTLNDASLAETLRQIFSKHFGKDKISNTNPLPSDCDDLPRLAAPHGIPYVIWHLGRQDPSKAVPSLSQELIRKVPFNDSPLNAHVLRPTLQTGTDALALAALSLLSRTSTQTSKSEDTSSASLESFPFYRKLLVATGCCVRWLRLRLGIILWYKRVALTEVPANAED